MANLNSPAGILDPSTGDLLQPLVINSGNAQWITYSGWSTVDPPAAVSFSIQGCTADPCTTTPLKTGLGTSSYMWEWPASAPPSFSFIQVTATDDAGNQGESLAPSTPSVFSFFDSNAAPNPPLTCSPSGGSGYVACTPLGGDDDIPTDPPSATTDQSCQTIEGQHYTVAFSGYSDPSMRADRLISSPSNPYGTNLWMLYSYPWLQYISNPCTYTPVVEIHLAESNVSTGPGGNSWSAWCPDSPCSNGTPIFPSETFTNGCGGIATNTCYSAHEVANFWPYVSGETETWYAVHLMYFLPPAGRAFTRISDGCLVTSVATGSPTALGWSSGGPSDCSNPNAFPSNNYLLSFQTLDGAIVGHPPFSGRHVYELGRARDHGKRRHAVLGCLVL